MLYHMEVCIKLKCSLIKEPLSRGNQFQKMITSLTTRKDDEKIKIQTAVKEFQFQKIC